MTALIATASLNRSPAAATAAIALAAVCFGLVPLFARELQALGISSTAIALYRYVFSAAVMLPFLPCERAKRRDALTLGIAALFMGLGWIGYLEAVKVVPIAAAGVVYMSYPLFALVFAWLLLGHRPTACAWMAGALIFGAAALLLNPHALSPASVTALLWSLPAPISMGCLIVVLSAVVVRLDALEKMACGMLGALVGLAPLALASDMATLLPAAPGGWALIVGLGLVTALVPQMLFTLASVSVGPVRSAAAGSFELPTMFAIGWLAFGEAIGPREVTAALLVLAAIALAPAIRPQGEYPLKH